MLPIVKFLAISVVVIPFGISMLLRLRISRELNATLPEGNHVGLFSTRDGVDVVKVHHQPFPQSHLSFASKVRFYASMLPVITFSLLYLLRV
jgi:hypothetical protein